MPQIATRMDAKGKQTPAWAAPFRYINCQPVQFVDHEHVGRVINVRRQLGPEYIEDVLCRLRSARIQRHGSYEAARKARENG